MFEALRERLRDVQNIEDRLLDAAIAVATEQRLQVRAGRRASATRRRDLRKELRESGASAAEVRAKTRGRHGSGISIDAISTGDGVTLTASDQVQHFRRVQGETVDVMAAFAKHFRVAEAWRARRGL